jgi:phospholipid/cholesterol/gamma-HCH transport system ATP-binding protein
VSNLSQENDIVVSIKNLSTKLGREWIHKGLDFTAHKGKIISIIGGSGSGKSTLLKEMLGLITPRSGGVQIFGHDILKASPDILKDIQRSYGVLFQQGALFSSLTVLENIIFPLKQFTRLNSDTMTELVLLKLSLVGLLPEVAYKYPSELSGGMQKRAALARALILDPKLVFLDEPASGLDPVSAKAQDKLLKNLQQSLNLTVILVTHDMNTLETISDQIVFLGQKKVLASGSYDEIRQNPHPEIQAYFHDVSAKQRGSH